MPTYQFTQNGITLTFQAATERLTGIFVDGTHWIEGPVTWIGQSPAATTTGRRRNGAQIDPRTDQRGVGAKQGYDSEAGLIDYGDALNDGYRLALNGPIDITPTSGSYRSIVATIGQDTVAFNQAVRFAMVMTVVSSDFIPPVDAYRPWYCGPSKQSSYLRASQVNTSLLPGASLGISAADVNTISDRVNNGNGASWAPDHSYWPSLGIHPAGQMPAYYREIGQYMSDACALLASNQWTSRALIGVLQWGIDSYGIQHNGGIFRGGGMHPSARYPAMVIMACLFGRTDWRDNLAAAFSCEHELFFYVAETKRVNIANKVGNFKVGETISNGAGWSAKMLGYQGTPAPRIWWSDETGTLSLGNTITGATSGATCTAQSSLTSGIYNFGAGGYTVAHVGIAEWGHNHDADHDGIAPPSAVGDSVLWTNDQSSTWYRRPWSGLWLGYATLMRALGLQQYWGGVQGSAYFDYQERYLQIESSGGPWAGSTWPPGQHNPPAVQIAAYNALWDAGPPDGITAFCGGSIQLSGTAAAATAIVAVQEGAAGTLPLSGFAAGRISLAAGAAGAVALSGAASASSPIAAVAAGGMPLAGVADSVLVDAGVTGLAAGEIGLTGSADAALEIAAAASALVSWSGASAAAVALAASASGSFGVVGVAAGVYDAPPLTATASGSIGFAGGGSATVLEGRADRRTFPPWRSLLSWLLSHYRTRERD